MRDENVMSRGRTEALNRIVVDRPLENEEEDHMESSHPDQNHHMIPVCTGTYLKIPLCTMLVYVGDIRDKGSRM